MVNALLAIVKEGVVLMNMVLDYTFGAVTSSRGRAENALYNTVYKNGADYNTAKNLHLELYKANPVQFDTIFGEMQALRFSGEEFDLKKQQQKYKTVGIVFVFLLILIFIIFIYKDLKK